MPSSRLLSLVARGEQVDDILRGVGAADAAGAVVALTGGGGVGKSTLAGKLIEQARATRPDRRRAGLRSAKSAHRRRPARRPLPHAGPARRRRRLHPQPGRRRRPRRRGRTPRRPDPVCSRRSVSTWCWSRRSAPARAIRRCAALVDVLVLLLQPETGDDLQWEKAGLLEVADVVVIHKADMPGADRVEAQVLATLSLSAGKAPPVLRVSARTGAGVEALWAAVASCPLRRGRADAGADCCGWPRRRWPHASRRCGPTATAPYSIFWSAGAAGN